MKLLHAAKKIFSKKFLIIFIILLLLGSAIYFFFIRNQNNQPIEYAKVTREDITSTVSGSGTLAGQNTADLRFKIGGKLAYVNVKVGDNVFQNQTLAGLDTQDLAIALQQARNNLTAKDAAAKNAEDQVKDSNSDETFDEKELRVTAQVARDNAYDSVKAAQRAFQDAVLTTPIAGTITQVNHFSGQNVSPSETVIEVVDWSKIFFDAEIDESDLSQVEINMPSEVELNAYPNQKFSGVVAEIKPQIKTTDSGATVVLARIELNNPNVHLISGLNGQAEITTQKISNALIIPIDALIDDNSVIIPDGESFKKVQVETGLQSDNNVEIKSGLEEGQQVVTNPTAVKLDNGKKFFGLF